MDLLEDVGEAAMVTAFLRGELHSPRCGSTVVSLLRQAGASARLIEGPNLSLFGSHVDLGDQVTLTHLRTELTGKHTLSLDSGEDELTGFPGGGRGRRHEAANSPLSEVIELLNVRFGTNFDASDALYFEQMLEEMLGDEQLVGEARANTVDNFLYGFGRAFDGRVIERRELNEQIFARVMEDKDFSAVSKDLLGKRMYEMVRARKSKPNN